MKPEHQRRKEVELQRSENLRVAMAKSRTARKDPQQMLERIFEGSVEQADLTPHYQAIARLENSFSKRNRAASIARFRELILLADHRTKLISTTPVIATYPHDHHNTFIGGLAAIATHGHAWLRPLDEWKIARSNPNCQFASLVRHLFARYAVPQCFDGVWFRHSRTQNWFRTWARENRFAQRSVSISLWPSAKPMSSCSLRTITPSSRRFAGRRCAP